LQEAHGDELTRKGLQTLVTPHNDLGNGRFADDNSKKSFRYDHLRKEAGDIQPYNGDHTIEGWRHALQKVRSLGLK